MLLNYFGRNRIIDITSTCTTKLYKTTKYRLINDMNRCLFICFLVCMFFSIFYTLIFYILYSILREQANRPKNARMPICKGVRRLGVF